MFGYLRLIKKTIIDLDNYNLKEGKYKSKDQVLQLSQEVCPDHSIKTCFIQQNGKNIMNNIKEDVATWCCL